MSETPHNYQNRPVSETTRKLENQADVLSRMEEIVSLLNEFQNDLATFAESPEKQVEMYSKFMSVLSEIHRWHTGDKELAAELRSLGVTEGRLRFALDQRKWDIQSLKYYRENSDFSPYQLLQATDGASIIANIDKRLLQFRLDFATDETVDRILELVRNTRTICDAVGKKMRKDSLSLGDRPKEIMGSLVQIVKQIQVVENEARKIYKLLHLGGRQARSYISEYLKLSDAPEWGRLIIKKYLYVELGYNYFFSAPGHFTHPSDEELAKESTLLG